MPRKLHLAVAVYGVGGPGQHGLWKDPRVPKNARVDISYCIRLAQIAEQALFDAMFIVDSQFINASYPSHYLNRLEPLTRLSAVGCRHAHITHRARRHGQADRRPAPGNRWSCSR